MSEKSLTKVDFRSKNQKDNSDDGSLKYRCIKIFIQPPYLDDSFLFWLPCPLTATSSVPWEYFLLEEAFDDEFELADGLVMEMPESLFMELDFLLEFSEWLLVLLRAPPEWSLRLELL